MGEKENIFNPSKSYQWEPTDKFEISGMEFNILLQSLRAVLRTEDAMRILLIKEASDNLENVLKKAVNSGVVKEAIPPGSVVEQPPLTLEKEPS